MPQPYMELTDTAIRPSVCTMAQLPWGYRHTGCLQLSHVTRPRTEVDPPRVELTSAGAYRLAALGAITFVFETSLASQVSL